MIDGEGVGVVETPVVDAPVAAEPQAPPVPDPAPTDAPVVEAEAQSPAPESTDSPPATPTEPATPVSPAKPWVPRADGTDLQIPGATLQADGSVRIPPETVGQMHRYLANREQVRQQIQHLNTELKTARQLADPQNNEAVIRSNMVIQGMLKAHEQGQLADWIDGFFQNLPLYEANAKAEALQRQLKAQQEAVQPLQQQQQWAVMEPGFRDSLDATLDQVLADPENAGIDRAALQAALWEDRTDLFRPATPEEKQEHGSDWTIDPRVFHRTLRSHRYFASRLKEAEARKAKTAAAQQVLQPPKPPPAVSTKGSPTPQATKVYNPESPEDWEREFRESLKAR